jgi:hypothetical protein
MDYLTLPTQETETIGFEESTLSYFALIHQLVISLQNPNNSKYILTSH